MLAPVVALATLTLTACVSDAVVVEPVAFAPVAARLKEIPDVPKCDPPAGQVKSSPEEVLAYGKCWRAAYNALFSKHKGLVKAVLYRERAAAKAVKLAKS